MVRLRLVIMGRESSRVSKPERIVMLNQMPAIQEMPEMSTSDQVMMAAVTAAGFAVLSCLACLADTIARMFS
jgi:hypothetical protein